MALKPIKIVLIAEDNNDKGNLLTRLSSDLFHCLGYCDFIFDVAKSGREVDITGRHRYEDINLTAECKATKTPIGGADLNKFYGVLDAERKSSGKTITGYFVSLSGFKASAIAQEQEMPSARMILIDGQKIVRELIDGGVVVSPERAVEAATRLFSATGINDNIDECATLVGYSEGWAWAVYAENDHNRTYMCLIHADGRPLSIKDCLAIQTIALVQGLEGFILPFINQYSFDSAPISGEESKQKYLNYLLKEYGFITLEGLPTDHEVGARRFRLEDLYVDLSLVDANKDPERHDAHDEYEFYDDEDSEISGQEDEDESGSIKHILSSYPRLAILGAPGAGKTTLLKRLAVHYARPVESRELDWDLPQEDWFPLVIRCRQLGALAESTIIDIIGSLAVRAEMPELSIAFTEAIRKILRDGRILLLVDGLDEISDPSKRQAFIAQLRTFLATYPNAHMVLTSRETGYRVVASSVLSICQAFRVAHLSPKAISDLTALWHQQVLGDSPNVENEARALADAIVSTDRVYRLAVNPLLLTTLLLVRRWVGQLPRRRSVLYDKAVDVLLMTWNVEGHAPIEREEAIPQLAYAAYKMMDAGKTSASSRQLSDYFKESRRNLPEILSYASLSVSEFLTRVEERSSLIVLSGHGIESGVLREIYEFKHLTFQEYLAATAIAEGYLPTDIADLPIEEIIGDRFKSDTWREVISLTAVLARRGGPIIVNHLIS